MTSTQKLILIVEDELKIANVLRDYLAAASFDTEILADGHKVVSWVQKNNPDLVLLDLMLPGQDGLDICQELRRISDVPIILVTARVDEVDRLLGLELGADDYICKPFSPREVVARVKTILRRVLHTADAPEHYRGLRIDEAALSASANNEKLSLTPVEFRLLALLSSTPGRVYSRDHLHTAIYLDGRIVSDRTIDSHIKNLRKKLRSVYGDEELVHSIYGIGYKLE